MPYLKQKRFEFFVRPRVAVGKYLEIYHLGEEESIVLLEINWEMSLIYSPVDLWSMSEIVERERGVSHVSRSQRLSYLPILSFQPKFIISFEQCF